MDPQAWLADVLARVADTPVSKLSGPLPWDLFDPYDNLAGKAGLVRPLGFRLNCLHLMLRAAMP